MGVEPTTEKQIATPQKLHNEKNEKNEASQEFSTWAEFEATPWPPQKMLCGNWLPEAGICMLWGPRGAAKSWTALALAASVASGAMFLGWHTAQAPTLYVDAEMNPAQLKKRMRELRAGSNFTLEDLKKFVVVSHAMPAYAETGFPKLHGGMAGWKLLRKFVDLFAIKLLILDNLSSLSRVGNEYEAEDWNYIRDQLLWFRRRGVTTLIIHHAGKPNTGGKIDQRGTSFREDIMDTVIKVTVTGQNNEETQVRWQFTKVREGFAGKPFKLLIRTKDDVEVDLVRDDAEESEEAFTQELKKLNGEGKSLRMMETETGISKSTLHRRLKRLKGNEIPNRML